MKLLFSFILLCSGIFAEGQVRRIGVLGSSTANGQGVPFDSSWVQKMRFHYRERALIDTVHKIAASTLDCYSGMPTGYVPPPGRNSPNTSYNITRLMTRTPVPTTVIVNYPTTNFDTFSDQEILFCLDSIRRYAMSFGAVCYISTTQPRDNFSDAGRMRLRYLNDLIKNYFGEYAIDFFTVLNNPVNNKLQSQFVLGDGIHVNSRGQDALFRQVLQKNIFRIDTSNVQRVLIDAGGATAVTDQWPKRWNHMADARRGIQVSNAVTTTNQLTSIGVEVINPISNATATDKGMGVSTDVGAVSEYPSFATSDHAFATSSVTNGKWRVFGLEPSKTYHIRFWGSQLLSGYRILQVKRSDETAWQEFNAGMNKSYTNAVTFAVAGKSELSFDLKVKSGSVGGHISVIDIVSTVSNQQSHVNQPPVAFAGSDTSIVLPATLQLNGMGVDGDGAVTSYQWRKIAGPSAIQISNATIASPVLSGLAAGAYSLELTVTDDGGRTATDTIEILVKPAVVQVTNQRILIDLGLANATTSAPDEWGKYWNNVTDARPGIRITNAVNTANQPTALQFEVVRQSGSTAGYDLNTRTSNAIGKIGDYPATATNDNAFAHNSITDGEWRFSGLDSVKTYTIKFWGSITGSGSRFLQVKPSYETNWKEYNASSNLNFNNGAVFTVTGRREVSFNIKVKSGSTFSYINIVDILVESPLTGANPVADAGADVSVRLPIDSIRLNGYGSQHPGGLNIAYNWRKINGPANYLLIDSLLARPLVEMLVEGAYQFELTVSDSEGRYSKDTVMINVLPALVNSPPVARAGVDQSIRLPVDSVVLDGSGSFDPEGGALAYEWRQLTGPDALEIQNGTSQSATVRVWGAGTFTFELLVSDVTLYVHRDTVKVSVLPPLIPPVARAGADLQITLPVNMVSLNAGSSSDTDGSVISYLWQKVAGPSVGNITNSGSATTDAVNLVQGAYTFALTVTDNDGLTGRDSVKVIVYQAANRPPVVNAGADLSITSPAPAMLNGSGSDPDGGALAYSWSQLSGPSEAILARPSSASTAISNLVPGGYQFRLVVTDNGGLSTADTVAVTVLAPSPVTSLRILIDAGLASLPTVSPDVSGKYWNNVTDARPGVRIANALNTSGQPTGLKFEVVNPAGAAASYDLNTRTSNDVGAVGDYPATATNDNALVHSSVTNGLWKLSGLDPSASYTIKFWGSIAMTGTRIVQIKPTFESAWQEFNSSMNRSYTTAATFTITGRSEASFDIRVKQGSSYGYINVIDIAVGGNLSTSGNTKQGERTGPLVSSDLWKQDSIEGGLTSLNATATPNPTTGTSMIRINNSYLGTLELQLMDGNGRPLRSWKDNKTGIHYGTTVYLTDQPSGTYFLIIKMHGHIEVLRIIRR